MVLLFCGGGKEFEVYGLLGEVGRREIERGGRKK
jgi:hypothetical protein